MGGMNDVDAPALPGIALRRAWLVPDEASALFENLLEAVPWEVPAATAAGPWKIATS